MVEVTNPDEWNKLAKQAGGDYLIFKHSTSCPISANAYREVSEFAKTGNLPVLLVKVIESRPLSQHIAGELLVAHASPQVILLKNGRPVWSATHYGITQNHIEAALGRYMS